MAKSKAKSHSKPRSTTKFIMYLILWIGVILTFFSMFATIFLRDSTILITLIPSYFVEFTAVSSFYFWKKKVEDSIKYNKENGIEFMNEVMNDIDND